MQARERVCLRLACALAAAGLMLAATPALAGATVRFASPTGDNVASVCTTEATACTLQRAVEVVAANGDEVIVLPGTYSEGADPVSVTGSRYVHGAAGQAVPQLEFAGGELLVANNATVARLRTTNLGLGIALNMRGGTAEQIFAIVSPGTQACSIQALGADVDAVLRDSICWGAGTDNTGVSVLAQDGIANVTLRNVTAIATSGAFSRGIDAQTVVGGTTTPHIDIDAKNVIAQGQQAAVRASTDTAGQTIEIVLENSNYPTEQETGPGAGTITNPGSGGNQIAPPHFANASGGDFHQLASSPTVDAGGNFFLMGSLDVDGDPRSVDGSANCVGSVARPDIGADEFVPNALDCVAPETGITGGPKAKTRKRRAGFNFAATELSTFQCSLDEKPFATCTPPRAYRKLKPGKHVFAVRAVDGAGNLDASPAERTWRIQGKKRKKRTKR